MSSSHQPPGRPGGTVPPGAAGGAPAVTAERPPVALDPAVLDQETRRWTPAKIALWVAIALVGALGWFMLAIARGEAVNAIWFVFAAVATYLIAYRFYSKFIEDKLVRPDDTRATPAEYRANGKDFMPTDRRVLYGHHFAAIAGAGPLVGPVLAAQMGYLPGTIWIIVGVILAGAVQDYLVLFFSMRRGGRSLGQMAREDLGVVGGTAAIVATLAIMIIITAILALVVVNALGESPWGVFSVAMTIPIALFMGVYLRYLRPGRVMEVSVIGFALLMLAIVAGGWVAENPAWAEAFTLERTTIAWGIIVYGFVAAILPVWLLLAAIALAVCLTIAAKRGSFRYLWIIALPLAFVTVITVYGSILKIFSSVPAVGYWAQHNAFREAKASGAETFGTARTPEAIDAVIRNTFIQGSLSVLFVVLAVIVIVTALVRTAQAFAHRDDPEHPSRRNTEDPYRPAEIYAPAGLVASAPEKELERQWAEYHRAHPQPRRRSHG